MVGVKSRIQISLERLRGNFLALLRTVSDASSIDPELRGAAPTALLAVVKANAYGHGIHPCAAVLAKAGAEWLGVTDAGEGEVVRERLVAEGIAEVDHPQLLVLCGTSGLANEAQLVVKHRLIPVVWTAIHLEPLALATRDAGLDNPTKVHLEIDTGMSRQGVRPGGELEILLTRIQEDPRIELDGLLTHFASTEVANSAQTAAQQEQFEAAINQVAATGMRPRWIHAGNSSYVDNDTDDRSISWLRSLAARVGARSMVRSGLALYGHLLPIEGKGKSLLAAKLLPVMTWKTQILALSEVPAGAAVGYSGTFVAQRPMRLALLPVGYADGFRRELSSPNRNGLGGWVVIRGQRAAVVGRVSMNLLTVDVSGIDGVCKDDEVVLLGEGITADDHACIAETLAYEILCGVRAETIVTT